MARTDDDAKPGETLEETRERLAGKGRATPSRREREAARKRPLVPDDRREARRQARERAAVQREKIRTGIAAGDERYLPLRDKGPQKRWIRDFVDARFSIGELTIPIMLVVIVLTFVNDFTIQAIGVLLLWTLLIAAVIDSIILGLIVRRRLRKKFGEDNVEKGVRWYAAMRAMQFRPLRLPKPRVKRWQWPS